METNNELTIAIDKITSLYITRHTSNDNPIIVLPDELMKKDRFTYKNVMYEVIGEPIRKKKTVTVKLRIVSTGNYDNLGFGLFTDLLDGDDKCIAPYSIQKGDSTTRLYYTDLVDVIDNSRHISVSATELTIGMLIVRGDTTETIMCIVNADEYDEVTLVTRKSKVKIIELIRKDFITVDYDSEVRPVSKFPDELAVGDTFYISLNDVKVTVVSIEQVNAGILSIGYTVVNNTNYVEPPKTWDACKDTTGTIVNIEEMCLVEKLGSLVETCAMDLKIGDFIKLRGYSVSSRVHGLIQINTDNISILTTEI